MKTYIVTSKDIEELLALCDTLDIDAMKAGQEEGRVGTSVIRYILSGNSVSTYDKMQKGF